MNKIYAYFCLFFIGSLLPFLIVEFYFQDYFTIALIAIFASVILMLCISIDYLKGKSIVSLDMRDKRINRFNWAQKKEESGRAASYYFRNRLH